MRVKPTMLEIENKGLIDVELMVHERPPKSWKREMPRQEREQG